MRYEYHVPRQGRENGSETKARVWMAAWDLYLHSVNHVSFSGPHHAAEWRQIGKEAFLAIACEMVIAGRDNAKAEVTSVKRIQAYPLRQRRRPTAQTVSV